MINVSSLSLIYKVNEIAEDLHIAHRNSDECAIKLAEHKLSTIACVLGVADYAIHDAARIFNQWRKRNKNRLFPIKLADKIFFL